MSHSQQLDIKMVESILQSSSIENLDMKEISNLFLAEKSISNYRPESIFQIDPRNGELIVYNSSRATRPSSGLEEKLEIQKKQSIAIFAPGILQG